MHPLDVISGHPQDVRLGRCPGRQIGTSPWRSNRIFRGLLGDVGGGRPRDVPGTNICRLGNNITYHYLLMKSIWQVDHEQAFDANDKFLARASKNTFSPSSVIFLHSTSNNQGISCFHKSSYTRVWYFYQMCFIQCWLIGFFEFHTAHSEI